MPSVRETCLAALQTTLAGISSIPSLTVDRNRDHAESEFPALIQVDGGHRTAVDQLGADVRSVDVTVEGYLQAATSAALIAAVDALYVAVRAAIDVDPTLGGKAIDTRELSMDLEIDRDGEKPTAVMLLALQIDFQHADRDVTTAV